MSINRNIFIHETDRAALQTLKAIPGFALILKAMMKVWDERLMYIENTANCVKASERQLKKYYDMLPPICEKLGIEVPDLFMELSPYPNAYTSGDTKPFIVMTSGLIETLPEDLIPTVLAHECGHIACHHVLYTTMGRLILTGALNHIPIPGSIAKIAVVESISSAFAYWMRCSEFSADRAAILCDGTPEKVMEMCARFAGFDKDIPVEIDLDAFMDQAKEYREFIKNNAVNKAMEFLLFRNNSHPLNAVRAYEANEWSNTDNFVKAKAYFDSYDAGSAPAELPISWNEKHFKGREYTEVERELLSFGFENVELVRSTEKESSAKEGTVIGVTIAGTNKYKEAEWYASDADVTVNYYLPLTNKEIAAMHPDEVKMANSAKYYLGKKYGFVKQSFAELGFENIVTEEIKDISKENDNKLGTVSMILIDKNPVFESGEWKPLSSEIKIYYHSLSD